ncbi:fluoride efflux transporter CrcB [Solilutibacter silvestris]|uniref:Fluoride-specific ion channel FluC n=1 Tax=Solilutibacter silvestris TaxID=1645665 RepID=A0A2K1PZA5_9GAMM|nr:fluoride efflux transporter CrcB [Lysobacter silvestris]PNS08126.1 crcB: protein CrcB [Lysobacter silvestris]
MLIRLSAVALGAVLGAWLRWGVSTWLNPAFTPLPLGTLLANLVGAYVIGLAMAGFGQNGSLGPELRLFLVTGLLGALTTFSTFSAESVTLLQRQMYGWAATHMILHVAGSLLMTVLGMWTWNALRGNA